MLLIIIVFLLNLALQIPVHQNLPQPPMKLLMAERRRSGVGEEKRRLFGAVTGQPGKEFISQVSFTY